MYRIFYFFILLGSAALFGMHEQTSHKSKAKSISMHETDKGTLRDTFLVKCNPFWDAWQKNRADTANSLVLWGDGVGVAGGLAFLIASGYLQGYRMLYCKTPDISVRYKKLYRSLGISCAAYTVLYNAGRMVYRRYSCTSEYEKTVCVIVPGELKDALQSLCDSVASQAYQLGAQRCEQNRSSTMGSFAYSPSAPFPGQHPSMASGVMPPQLGPSYVFMAPYLGSPNLGSWLPGSLGCPSVSSFVPYQEGEER